MITETFKAACMKAARHTDQNDVAAALKALAIGLDSDEGKQLAKKFEKVRKAHIQVGYITPGLNHERNSIKNFLMIEIEETFGPEGLEMARKAL